MTNKCPVCGSDVAVHTSDEGTSCYVPKAPDGCVLVSKHALMGWYDVLSEALSDTKQYDFRARAKDAIRRMMRAAKDGEK